MDTRHTYLTPNIWENAKARTKKCNYQKQADAHDWSPVTLCHEIVQAKGKSQWDKLWANAVEDLLEFDTIEANKFLAQHMHVILGEKLFRIKRLRSADDVPMMLEVTYLPVSQFFSLTAHDVEQKSLYQIFEEDYNIKIGVAEEEFKASIARSDDATLLQISEGSPVLSLTRTTYNDRNIIVEFTLSVARADQFRYKIVHTRS